MTKEKAPARRCGNCDAILAGRFCHRCGQQDLRLPQSVSTYLKEQGRKVLSRDSKAARSLRALILKPGELTRSFLDGQHVRYFQPFPTFLIAAGAFLFVHAYSPFVTFNRETRTITNSLSAVSVGFELTDEWLAELQARGISIDEFSERFSVVISALLPVLLLATVVLFSAGFAVFYRRTGVKSVGHVVFALHWSAFYLILTTLDRLLSIIGIRGLALPVVFSFLALIYLIVASRKVYEQPWLRTIFKSTVLMGAFFFLIAAWLFATAYVARSTL